MRTYQIIGLITLVLLGFGCSIGGSKLQEWSESKNGETRLGAYLADVSRDRILRNDALDFLIQGNHFPTILGVLENMEGLEQKFWVKQAWLKVAQRLEKQRFSMVERIEAASLAYFLLSFRQHLDGYANEGTTYQQPFADFAVVNLVTWSLETLKNEEEVPKGTKKLSDVMFAAAVAYPKGVLPQFEGFLSTLPSERDFLLVTDILHNLKSLEAHQIEAKSLLVFANKQYPNVSVEVATRLLRNRNETLLRFLLDTLVDVRVKPEVRLMGLKSVEVLKELATSGLLAALRVDEPGRGNLVRTQALEQLWRNAGGKKVLKKALLSLPPSGTYWPEGVKFRDEVRRFCDQVLAESAADIQDQLIDVSQSENPISQLYATECILRLYPNDAAVLLAPLKKIESEKEILGWSEDGVTTLSDYLRTRLNW